jgi:hypothetical protein
MIYFKYSIFIDIAKNKNKKNIVKGNI